ncbi:hypothetical protein PV327_005994 [Microctonus hyperodae]|uniref:Uncharacterized protein n=1 Tax=Microctonus hyperodae TaxID=165561 RepID=A0AA39L0E5_MICHY|nr:hypothetical protein PV327_005994 [Microctonus hyperodae]
MIFQLILIALISNAFCQEQAPTIGDRIARAQELMEKLPPPEGYEDIWYPVDPQVFEDIGTGPRGFLRVLKRRQ